MVNSDDTDVANQYGRFWAWLLQIERTVLLRAVVFGLLVFWACVAGGIAF